MTSPTRPMPPRPRRLAAALALLAALVAPGAAQPTAQVPEAGVSLTGGQPVPAGAVAVVSGRPVPTSALLDELVHRYQMGMGPGADVMKHLTETAMIRSQLRRRGLAVTSEEIASKETALREALSQQGQDLEATLSRQGVSLAKFRSTLRTTVALDKLVRNDAKLPPDHEVSPLRSRTWLEDNLKSVTLEQDPARLPEGAVATVDGEPISREEFVRELLVILPTKKVKEAVEVLIQATLVDAMLAERGLEISEADAELEFQYQKRRFEQRPDMKGVRFEDVVLQSLKQDIATWRASRAFHVKTAIGLLGRRMFDADAVKAGYEAEKGRFGPMLRVQHIMIQASDHPKARGIRPTFAEAETTIRRILEELRKGARFEDRARLYSQDNATRFNDGLLPPFTPADRRLEPNFVKAATALEIGEVSEPVRTGQGWHVLRLVARDPIPPLAEVEDELRHVLATQAFQKAFDAAGVGYDLRLPDLRQ